MARIAIQIQSKACRYASAPLCRSISSLRTSKLVDAPAMARRSRAATLLRATWARAMGATGTALTAAALWAAASLFAVVYAMVF
jgi:hypothetical protein